MMLPRMMFVLQRILQNQEIKGSWGDCDEFCLKTFKILSLELPS